MRVKTTVGDKCPIVLRVRTSVVWTGLLRKLYEQREVRVFYNPPRGQAPLYKAMRFSYESGALNKNVFENITCPL